MARAGTLPSFLYQREILEEVLILQERLIALKTKTGMRLVAVRRRELTRRTILKALPL